MKQKFQNHVYGMLIGQELILGCFHYVEHSQPLFDLMNQMEFLYYLWFDLIWKRNPKGQGTD